MFQTLARRLAAALLFIAASLLAACQTAQPVGETAIQSAAAARYLGPIRASNGLGPLAPDPALDQAALQQARYMAQTGRMKHTTGFGRAFRVRVRENGIRGIAAENIAAGSFGMDELFQRWLNSPPHRRNMLDPAFSRYGLASAADASGKRRYWALVLAQ